jgi:tetratricopeptide (TPR) repeat protein
MADLFEEYKEALKRGHVAVLRGELEDAIGHYRAAAQIAPYRPLPHSSLGGVLLRLGRTDEAVAAYEEAVRRGPTDETALGGLADALLAAGRRAEAAEHLDRLAGIQLEKGRQAEALATRGLARAVRAAGGIPEPGTPGPAAGSSGEEAVAESPTEQAMSEAGAERAGPERDGIGPEAVSDMTAAGAAEPVVAEEPAPVSADEPARITGDDDTAADEEAVRAAGDAPVNVEDAAADEPAEAGEPAPEQPRAWEIVVAADQASVEGRTDDAVRAYVQAAIEYRQLAALDAGLDACQQALTLAPGAPEVHLALAGLYFDCGWGDRAADKLLLLDRLLQLQEPNGWQDQLSAMAREHASEDPRLAALIARGAPQAPPSSGD